MDEIQKDGISVLLPTNRYNSWLDGAVESLLSQKVSPLEIIIIADGISLPAELHWLADPRVRIVHNRSPRGLAHALNLGAREAQYQYLSRLDSDDIAEPGRLAIQRKFLNKNPEVVLVGTFASLIDERGEILGVRSSLDGSDRRLAMLKRNRLIHPSVMLRRSAFEAAGGYDEDCNQMEDYELWLRLGQLGELRTIPEVLTRYRVHGGQMSNSAPPWGYHVRAVIRQRRALARCLNQPMWRQLLWDIAWIAGQYWRRANARSKFVESNCLGMFVKARAKNGGRNA